jgi:hypothetical protein
LIKNTRIEKIKEDLTEGLNDLTTLVGIKVAVGIVEVPDFILTGNGEVQPIKSCLIGRRNKKGGVVKYGVTTVLKTVGCQKPCRFESYLLRHFTKE